MAANVDCRADFALLEDLSHQFGSSADLVSTFQDALHKTSLTVVHAVVVADSFLNFRFVD